MEPEPEPELVLDDEVDEELGDEVELDEEPDDEPDEEPDDGVLEPPPLGVLVAPLLDAGVEGVLLAPLLEPEELEVDESPLSFFELE
ncbi:MAG TPA: hypothetical protein VGG33_15460 [Polyangia bacterium]